MIKDLSKNSNPYYPTFKLKRLLRKQIKKIGQYPNANSELLEVNLSETFKIEPNNILLTNGSLEGMDLILKRFSQKKIGIFSPTFWGISVLAKKNQCEIYSECLSDPFIYNLEDIAKLARKVKLIYICNPNNPTLAEVDKKELLALIKQNSDCHFLIDETVLAFSEEYEKKTLYKEVSHLNNLTVILSFSKIFNIGGMRLAILFSNQDFVTSLKKEMLIYKNNIFNEGIVEYLANNFTKIDRNKFKNTLEKFIDALDKRYVEKYKINDGSFILIKFNDNINSDFLVNYLEKKGYIIANISQMYLEMEKNWVRISIGKKNTMLKLARIINNYVRNK